MRFATWNVNSIRTRLERVLAWLAASDTDVLAMQEIKCRDEQFPREAFAAAGYEVVTHGLNQWNGVAIASRIGLDEVERDFVDAPAFADIIEPRAIGATCAGVRIWSVYVPNGREVDHPHYAYKIDWLHRLARQAQAWRDDEVAIVGDFNVALEDTDVWDIEFFAGKTHVTAPEREAVAALTDAGFTEVTRTFLPDPHTYTYWDYQQLRFPRNEGMRIDYVFATTELAQRIASVEIHRNERKGKGASDHVPVVVTLD